MSKSTKHTALLGGVLLALMSAAPGVTFAESEREESDDASARRQAMDEWYNESYAERNNGVRRQGSGHGKPMWTPGYERYMRDAAARERARYAATLPQSDTSAIVRDPSAPSVASGTTWTNIGPTKANYEENGGTLNVTDSGRVNAIVTDPVSTNTIYVGFSGGGVWKTTDGGTTWAAKTETLGSLAVGSLEMDPNSSSTIYLGLGDPFDGTGVGMAKSTDGANSWSTPVLLGDSAKIPDIQVAPGNSTIVLAATDKGLYRSTNSGASFSKVTIATGQAGDPYVWSIAWGGGTNFALSLEANKAATTGTTDGQIWRSTDNGATWTKATGVTDTLGVGRITIASGAANRAVMYGLAAVPNPANTSDLSNIFKSTDGGATWTGIAKTGTTYKSYSNTNAESSKLNTLLGGQGWYNHAVLVDNANANIAYFGGQLLLAKTTDGGTTFAQRSNWLAQFSLPYVHADFHAAHMASNGTVYMGTDGGIFRSTDSATTFTHTLNIGIASHLIYQVGSSINNRNAVIAGLQDNGTRVRETNTSIFNQEIGGDGFGCNINRANANTMLGSLYYNRIQKSTDGGLNFSQACSGITECNNSSTGSFITRIVPFDGDSTGNTVYTYSSTKVYKSTNYAGSWSAIGATGMIVSGAIVRNVGIAPSNGSVIGVVSSGGGASVSLNGGTSWTSIGGTKLPGNGNSISYISFDPTNTSIIYVASVAPDATKSHLWKSTNGGTSFVAIDSAASGFPAGIPVNSLQPDPTNGQYLYAGTHLGVYRSTDGGATWARFGSGLPLVNVTDLYLAPDASLVRAATFGRSVWELVPAANANPVASFNFTTSNLTATFTDGSTDSDGTIASRSWNFGDGGTSTATNPSRTYASAGTYNVTLTVTDNLGATNALTRAVTVSAAPNVAPTANFSFVTTGLTANFTDSSTDSDGTIASRSWNFGDSTTSTTTNPSKTYAAAGTYSVSLTVTDNGGLTNTKTSSVTVTAANTAPTANFTFTTSGLVATFTDSSTDPQGNGTITSRSWNFGDSTTSTATNPSKTYSAAGTYSVSLTVTDNGGLTNTKTSSVTVAAANVAPTANFSFTTSNLVATFTDSSTDSDGTIASRSWNFGDSTTSTATNPSKTYAAAGTYSVSLTVTDNGGLTNTKTSSVTVSTSGCGGTVLCNGVAVTGLSAAINTALNYTMVVPAGATGLKFVIAGGTGDADLYVKFGSAPTTAVYDCRPYIGGNAETCNIATAQAGTYYVMVRAYAAYSGVSLTGSYTAGTPPGPSFTNNTAMAIGDNVTINSTIAVTGVTGAASATLKVPVNITHTYQGDLKIDLIAPNGTIFPIWNRTGAGTDNINQTFTVNASSITAPNGTWTLRVADQAAGDTGTLNSWGLQF